VAKEKERYAREMKDYIPQERFDSKETGKTKKAKKDPNAPKGAKGAYMYFSSEYRDRIKEENPDMSFGEIGKALGEKWKVISSEEKSKFEKLAKKDKERHQRELAEYQSKQKLAEAAKDSDGMDDDDDDDSDDE
jgi:ribosome-binding protein aMBF1 (putative translation factor)